MAEDGAKAPRRAGTPAGPNAQSGYRKGDETRERILVAALKAFGDAGFRAATTRQITERAGVSLPALQYYYGDKEGLYRACAEAIVGRLQDVTAGVATDAVAALRAGCAPKAARAHLKALLGALARFLAGSREAEGWAQFVAGELQDPGPAFEILYERLWRPGGELTAALMGRITGRAAHDPEDRLKAQILISALLAFQAGRKQLTLRALGWSKIGEGELALILSVLNAQIDAIATADNGLSRLHTDERTSTVAMPRGNQP
jgi:TetR/AcrR family transcriptional regulator, regulator of cefoperazone and chloramphenicol sensitivity